MTTGDRLPHPKGRGCGSHWSGGSRTSPGPRPAGGWPSRCPLRRQVPGPRRAGSAKLTSLAILKRSPMQSNPSSFLSG